MSLYQRVLGNPFVYNHVRPLVVGGVDHAPSFRVLGAGPDDVVLDVGCGTGDALNHLSSVRAYHGYDTDPIAIEFARKRAAGRGDMFQFHCGMVDQRVIDDVKPTRVMLCGLLHHLSDDQVTTLLEQLSRAPSVQRITTVDVVYLPGRHVNNFFAWLDRGKHVRDAEGYRRLIRRASLEVASESIVRSHPEKGRAEYLVFGLERPTSPRPRSTARKPSGASHE